MFLQMHILSFQSTHFDFGRLLINELENGQGETSYIFGGLRNLKF